MDNVAGYYFDVDLKIPKHLEKPNLNTADPSFAIQATQLNNKRKRGKKSVKKDCEKKSVESDLNNVD